jgi:hypothetical protein
MKRFSVPWTVWTAFVLALACCLLLVWRKRPFRSDAEKFCRVAELSGCPPTERSAFEDDCKLSWLERSMWNMEFLIQRRKPGDPQGGAFIRRWASLHGLDVCGEADVIERERDLRKICGRSFLSDCDVERVENASCRAEDLRTSWGKELLKQLLAIRGAQERAQRMQSVAAEWAECPAAELIEEDDARELPSERPGHGDEDEIAPGHIVVTYGTPAIDGELERAAINKAMGPNLRRLGECLLSSARMNLASHKKIQLHWIVTVKGKATRIEIEEEDVGAPEVLRCVRDVIASIEFPRTHRGITEVVYPLRFRIGLDHKKGDEQ